MKKAIYPILFMLGLCMIMMSCNKNDDSSSSIETSYWSATMSDNGRFYLGIEEITDSDRNLSPFPIDERYTNYVSAIIYNANGTYLGTSGGFACLSNDNVLETEFFAEIFINSYGMLPTTFSYDGNTLTCTFDNENLTFHKISAADFNAISRE